MTKTTNWIGCGAAAVLGLAGSALAQPYYALGAFNNWTNPGVQLNDIGGGVYSGVISPLSPNAINEFKVNVGDWSASWPFNGNVKAVPTGSELTVLFHSNPAPNDGWMPNHQRVGYIDQGGAGFDIIGSFNGWSDPIAVMTPVGNGVYSAIATIDAGSYEFKFRKAGDWGMSYGMEFGDPGPNATVDVAANGTQVEFLLDIPGGRWTTNIIPAPGAAALMAMGGILAMHRRRR